MGIIRTLLIILLVYYGFKFLMRLLAPVLMKKAAEKVNERMNQQFGGQNQRQPQYDSRQEGEVTVQKTGSQKSSSRSEGGDYVDFEEVKD